MGRGEQPGSLEPGKAADVIAVDMSALRHHPLYDPVAHLIHTDSGCSVSHVWVDGRCLLDDGCLTSLDEEEIRRAASAWQDRIRPQ